MSCKEFYITHCILEDGHEGHCVSIEDQESVAFKNLTDKVNTLFDAIKHGDQEHQDWLEKAIKEHFGL